MPKHTIIAAILWGFNCGISVDRASAIIEAGFCVFFASIAVVGITTM